jgi:hypothetical protein
MKTRLLSLLLVVIMAVSMLVSCGEKDTGKTSTGGGSTTGGTTTTTTGSNWWDDVDFNGQTLTIQVSTATDNELASGGRKYMEGPDVQIAVDSGSTGTEKVQNEVYLRNQAAMSDLNVTLKYVYSTEEWGSVKSSIVEKETAGTNCPDMYCDMMYDMVAASLENNPTKVFANILKLTTTNVAGLSDWRGDGYFNISSSAGYYTDLMSDMALSEDKMYLIASDYYLDVLRAMFVMPFNLQMYVDRVNADDTTGEDLYQLALDGDWTWDELMKMSNVYSGSGTATINSDNLLMALSVGGLSATGLIYSTAFTNYTTGTDSNGRTTYTLNSSSSIIDQIFQKTYQLVSTSGVVCVTGGDTQSVIDAKEKFTKEGALFAGPSMLGVIEEDDFQSMTKLSILPVPKLNASSEYNTAINSRARVGAISYSSQNKVAMSAFIQYQTENSEDVKNEYFSKAMSGKYLAGAGAGSVLTMIYDNIGSNKASILDNLVLARDWSVGVEYAWTQLIKADNFTGHATDINSQYKTCVDAKQSVLNAAIAAWYLCD